jgi:hypothetical protein
MPPRKIMLIRHAEKPLDPPPFGIDETGVESRHSLTPRGWQRAGALVDFFVHPAHEAIETPTTLYATRAGISMIGDDGADIGKSLRPQQTITPLARKLRLQVNSSFDVGQEQALGDEVLAHEGVVLIAWVHKYLSVVATMVKCTAAPAHWPPRYDLVWVLDRSTDGYAFTELNQSLLDGDA